MVKHASSHGFAVLICTVISAYLVDLVRPYHPIVLEKMDALSRRFVSLLGLPFSVEEFSIILLAVILAMVWGVFFRLQQKE